MNHGIEVGDTCNRDGCLGTIHQSDKEGCCSCHISPPCSYCTKDTSYCDTCDWNADDEQYTMFKSNTSDEEYFKKQAEKHTQMTKLFNDMYNGKLDATELVISYEGHTHFSMKKRGVFPKGLHTVEDIVNKVKGSFGGRMVKFLDLTNSNNTIFEYITYTD